MFHQLKHLPLLEHTGLSLGALIAVLEIVVLAVVILAIIIIYWLHRRLKRKSADLPRYGVRYTTPPPPPGGGGVLRSQNECGFNSNM